LSEGASNENFAPTKVVSDKEKTKQHGINQANLQSTKLTYNQPQISIHPIKLVGCRPKLMLIRSHPMGANRPKLVRYS
jgi:hypothetical protein